MRNNFAHWLQVAANVTLILGLGLVALQIRQSNDIAAAQLFHSNVESTVARDIALLGESADEAMRRITMEPEAATPADYLIADRVFGITIRQYTRAVLFSNAGMYGLSSTVTPEGFVRTNYVLFSSPYGIAFLDQTIEAFEGRAEDFWLEHVKLTRQLAAASLARDDRGDRIERLEAVLAELGR